MQGMIRRRCYGGAATEHGWGFWYRYRRSERRLSRSHHEGLACVLDGRNPSLYLFRALGLKIKRSDRCNDPESVQMLLQHDLCARVDFGQIEESKKLVFCRGLVVCQMRWSQHKPSLLPGLRQHSHQVTNECSGHTDLAPLALLPEIARLDDAFVHRVLHALRLVRRLPRPFLLLLLLLLFLVVFFRLLAAARCTLGDRGKGWLRAAARQQHSCGTHRL